MTQIIINQKVLSLDDILAQKYQSFDFNNYEKNTLDFCYEWLSGKQSFQTQTSGSTGKPKLISIQRQQMQASAEMTAKALNLQASYKALCCINTNYIGGKMMLVRSFVLGLDLEIITATSNPFLSERYFENHDFIALVPLQLGEIIKTNAGQNWLNQTKAIIVGGASVSYALEKKIQALKSPMYSTFGMTETVSHIALKRLNGKAKSAYYKTLEGVEIKQDERNCLMIKSPSTLGKVLTSNDLVNIIDKNTFEHLGRWDNVINSGGVKIQVEEVEKIIAKVFDKLDIQVNFFLTGILDEKLGQKACIVIESPAFDKNMENQIIDLLAEKIDIKFKIPKTFVYKNTFVRTETGKIKRTESL